MQEYTSGQMLPLERELTKTAKPGRKCRDCTVVLSIYNEGEYCSQCHNPRKANRSLMKIPDGGET